ncbi:retrovirus-related pol polyprotein from transposon TNT 1-94 [Tanacetum coccineum]
MDEQYLGLHTETALSKDGKPNSLCAAASFMLIFAKAPLFLWAEAVATATSEYLDPCAIPTNDYDDVGKLKAKADIGIFVGYAPTKKAYRIYNKRTRKIQETVHVAFDELTEGLTSVQTRRSRSALVKDPEPPSVPPTKKQVDDLFQWFDDDEVVPIPPVVPITQVTSRHRKECRWFHLPQKFISKALLQLLKASCLIKYLYQTYCF